jgi:hypothetical protein
MAARGFSRAASLAMPQPVRLATGPFRFAARSACIAIASGCRSERLGWVDATLVK